MAAGKPPGGSQPVWFIYILRCGDDSLYTGITTDVDRRLAEHRAGRRGARSLRGRGPLQPVLTQPVGSRSLALRLEHRVKRLPRADKERLVARKGALVRLLEEIAGDRNLGDGPHLG